MEEEKLKKLKESLDHNHKWPSLYMFKFIVPTISSKFEELAKVFPNDIDLVTKLSKNGKYTSVTIKEVMLSSDEVLLRYSEVRKIEGVMAL